MQSFCRAARLAPALPGERSPRRVLTCLRACVRARCVRACPRAPEHAAGELPGDYATTTSADDRARISALAAQRFAEWCPRFSGDTIYINGAVHGARVNRRASSVCRSLVRPQIAVKRRAVCREILRENAVGAFAGLRNLCSLPYFGFPSEEIWAIGHDRKIRKKVNEREDL